MIAPGLCSITFRSLTRRRRDRSVACRAGVEGIEWGADGHAPPGGGPTVEALARPLPRRGLEVVSYGSYLGLAPPDGDDDAAVDAVLDDRVGAGLARWCASGPSSV